LVNIGVALLLADPFEQVWKYLFFLQHATHNVDFYTESWSLAVEEWFYVLFPLILWLYLMLQPGRLSVRRALPFVAAFFLISMLVLRCVLVYFLDPTWDSDVRRTWLFRLDAPLYGVLAAAFSVYFPETWRKYRSPLSAFGMTLFFISLWLFFHSNERSLDHSFFMRTFFFSITSLSVACILPVFDCWKEGRGPIAGWVTAISLWSYSLYLCQIPIHRVVERAVGHSIQESALAVTVVMVATATLSIAVAAIVYRVYELPMTALRERFTSR
jgi:peptidoglycan/LPS O-acetylase OafA/YrhL